MCPQLNKAGYTATQVACRWAEAVMEKVTGAFGHLGRCSELKTLKNTKKVKWGWTDGRTDRRTDRRTDGRTNKAVCRVAYHATKKRGLRKRYIESQQCPPLLSIEANVNALCGTNMERK